MLEFAFDASSRLNVPELSDLACCGEAEFPMGYELCAQALRLQHA
jgi:hypothetical protein